jgi:uncharacterized protein YbaR (Trm112 family)
MFTPLVDILRCPNAHDETWLVASIDRSEERDIREGTLGCPICLAEYPIRDGVVRFADVASSPPATQRESDAVRLAAALDLTEARMTAVLHGVWGALAPIVRGMSPAQLLLVNPPLGIASGDGVSIVQANTAPIAHGSADAVAFDASASDAMIASLVAILKGGGRMLGPAATSLPDGLIELARDDEVWVAQLEPGAVSSPIQLKRRPAE